MQNAKPSLLARDDTFFGVCEGLGEDFGVHPNLLRLGFAGLLFWNPVAALIAYPAAGVVVALARWVAPNPRAASVVKQEMLHEAQEAEQLPLAA